MEQEMLYEAPNIEIGFDSETRIMHCKWFGYQSKDLIQECGQIIYDLFKSKGCTKILNDNTMKTGPWYHSVEWTAREWFPIMIQAGLKQFAWVFPRNVFARLSAKRAMPDTHVVRSFYSHKEAFEWLLTPATAHALIPRKEKKMGLRGRRQ